MTETLPAVVELPPDWSENQTVAIAREVALNIRDLDTILAAFKLTQDQYVLLQAQPYFRRVLEASVSEWEAAKNTPERIKLQAAVALENALPTLSARMKSSNEDLNKAVETGKLFAKLAGLGDRESAAASGEKIVISINLGKDEKIVLEQAIAPAEVRADAEGKGNALPVPVERKG